MTVFLENKNSTVSLGELMQAEHKLLLNKSGYLGSRKIVGLFDTEHNLINSKGYWLEALSNGTLKPITSAQDNFIKVCCSNAAPETDYEKIWLKFYVFKILTLIEIDPLSALNNLNKFINKNFNDYIFDQLSVFLSSYESKAINSGKKLAYQRLIELPELPRTVTYKN